MEYIFFYETEIGKIGIAETGGEITHLSLAAHIPTEGKTFGQTPLLSEAAKQLREYLGGERKTFDLPLAPIGTEFQKRVWANLLAIPYGQTRSYKQVAQAVGKPGAARAVGGANHENPILIIIPCHRVVGADGKLVGFGAGLPLKERLLQLEQESMAHPYK